MKKVITENIFNEIKTFLNKPILVKPSIKYTAKQFGYNSGTISLINRFNTYKDYKDWQKQHIQRYLDNEFIRIAEERQAAMKEIHDFNNEWFFGGEE